MKVTPRWVRRGVQYSPRYVPPVEVKHTVSGNSLDGSVLLHLTLEAHSQLDSENRSMTIVLSSAEIDSLVAMRNRVIPPVTLKA